MVDEVISWDDEDGTAIGATKVLNKFTNEKYLLMVEIETKIISELDKFSNKKIDLFLVEDNNKSGY